MERMRSINQDLREANRLFDVPIIHRVILKSCSEWCPLHILVFYGLLRVTKGLERVPLLSVQLILSWHGLMVSERRLYNHVRRVRKVLWAIH